MCAYPIYSKQKKAAFKNETLSFNAFNILFTYIVKYMILYSQNNNNNLAFLKAVP